MRVIGLRMDGLVMERMLSIAKLPGDCALRGSHIPGIDNLRLLVPTRLSLIATPRQSISLRVRYVYMTASVLASSFKSAPAP
jgi:hypothetical protein